MAMQRVTRLLDPAGRAWRVIVQPRPPSANWDWEVRDPDGRLVADGWSYKGPDHARTGALRAYRKASGATTVHVIAERQ